MGGKAVWTIRGTVTASDAQPSATEANPASPARRGASPRLTDHRCHLTRGRIGRPSGPTAIDRCPQGREPPASRSSTSAPNPTATSDRSITAGTEIPPDGYNRRAVTLLAAEYGLSSGKRPKTGPRRQWVRPLVNFRTASRSRGSGSVLRKY